MIDLTIMQDASEVIHYDRPGIPLCISDDNLADYPDRKALCHWHEDIELIYITEGAMNYHINGKNLLLNQQDCLVVNSRQLHYGYSHLNHNCRFICIVFHPKILGASQGIYAEYVMPFIDNKGIEYLYYTKHSPNYSRVRESITRILSLKIKREDAYELKIISTLHLLWHTLLGQCQSLLQQEIISDDSGLTLQKKMVSYIYEHYQEPLTLKAIAASASISRSKCCMIFKEYLHQPPIDFLNKYRLKVSGYLLTHTQSSITEIALSCGFNHLSYFSKIFLREYGCTPTEYRKQMKIPDYSS